MMIQQQRRNNNGGGGGASRLMLLSFLVTVVASTLATGTDNNGDGSFTYHSAPKEINVDAKLSYDEKFMALMKSPCRPEKDGYFGSTYGHYPYSIEYGFQIETVPNSKLTEVITAVDDYIVDEILTNIYPAMCGYRRRRGRSLIESGTATTHSGRPGGFHFGQTLELPHGKHVTLCEWINKRPVLFAQTSSILISTFSHLLGSD